MFGLSVTYDIHIKEEDNLVVYSKMCSIKNKLYKVELNLLEHKLLTLGSDLIQDILPKKSPEEREFLINGLTPAEWDSLMTEMEEENE